MKTIVPFLLILSLSAIVAAEEWTAFRGVRGQGVSATSKPAPTTWQQDSKNVKWATQLDGVGWSSPVIIGNQVWMTSATFDVVEDEANDERLQDRSPIPRTAVNNLSLRAICVDRESGKVAHDLELFKSASPDPIHTMNSYASPTAVIGKGRVYCHFGTYGTACVDTTTGEVLWTNSELAIDHVTGPGSSPVLWQDKLIFNHDGLDKQSIVALDAGTGKIAWQTKRSGRMAENGQFKKAYGTPLIIKLDGKDTVLSNAANWLYAYDPATGEELWRHEYGMLGFSNVPLLLIRGDMVYVCTGFMKSELQALKLKGRKTPPEVVWRFNKQVPAVTSPLLVDNEIYFVSDNGGVLTCVDATTGESIWRERIGGKHAASPIFADGHIYVPNRQGETLVIKPGRSFSEVAVNRLPDPILATPAVVDGSLILRTEKALYRIEK